MLRNEKILLTGPTSQVALPLAAARVRDNEVVGLARLSKEEDRERLRAIGVTPHAADMATDDFSNLPDDFSYVLNFAVVRTDDALASLPLDTSRLVEKIGPTRVSWRDGIRRMVEVRNPELLK